MDCRNFIVRGARVRFLALFVLMRWRRAAGACARRPTRTSCGRRSPTAFALSLCATRLAPVVSTSVNYLVGSNESPAGFPGTAHAQEHMMFRGSAGLSADQLADIGSIMGGDFNANTSEGMTQYLFTVPSTDLDIALHIEALRMADVTDSKEGWDQERGAIEQEVAAGRLQPPLHHVSAACAPLCSAARPMSMTRWARRRHSTRPTPTC